MMGAARSKSSHVLCIAIVWRPPMNISEVYSSIALLLSPTYGTYCNIRHVMALKRNEHQSIYASFTLMTMTWSGCSPGSNRMPLLETMSSTTLLFEISFERNVCGAE